MVKCKKSFLKENHAKFMPACVNKTVGFFAWGLTTTVNSRSTDFCFKKSCFHALQRRYIHDVYCKYIVHICMKLRLVYKHFVTLYHCTYLPTYSRMQCAKNTWNNRKNFIFIMILFSFEFKFTRCFNWKCYCKSILFLNCQRNFTVISDLIRPLKFDFLLQFHHEYSSAFPPFREMK